MADPWSVLCGDSGKVLRALPGGCVDVLVTDPPGAVGIGRKAWDSDMGGMEKWVTAHAEVFGEALRVSKSGAWGLVWALPKTSDWTAQALRRGGWAVEDVVTHLQAQGWPKRGRLLRPASEHWILIRKPGGEAANPLIDERGHSIPNACLSHDEACAEEACAAACAVAELVKRAGIRKSGTMAAGTYGERSYGGYGKMKAVVKTPIRASTGTADRFFPVFRFESKARFGARDVFLPPGVENENPAAKPLPLCAWLVSLVSKPGELVLDPFAGWGSIPVAALLSGRRVLAVERDPKSADMIRARMVNAAATMAAKGAKTCT